jgi:Short repeat of unknown function (DUF308)
VLFDESSAFSGATDFVPTEIHSFTGLYSTLTLLKASETPPLTFPSSFSVSSTSFFCLVLSRESADCGLRFEVLLRMGDRWWLALVGLLGIAVGILTFAWPGITALVLLLFIAGWAIATGVLQIVGAIRLRKEIENEWLLIASGVLSVIFGLILAAQPGTGALALLYVIGIYAILYGILEIWLSLRLREHATS